MKNYGCNINNLPNASSSTSYDVRHRVSQMDSFIVIYWGQWLIFEYSNYLWHRLCRMGLSRRGSCPRHDPRDPRDNTWWSPPGVSRSAAPPPAWLTSTEHSCGTWPRTTRGFPEYMKTNILRKKYFVKKYIYRGCVDPSEELMIRREIREIMKKASELSDKILLPLSVVAQVTIHVCCFVLGK